MKREIEVRRERFNNTRP